MELVNVIIRLLMTKMSLLADECDLFLTAGKGEGHSCFLISLPSSKNRVSHLCYATVFRRQEAQSVNFSQ